ncbi:MAG TPA: LamG-like jellyroll fold domain-containing protein, partial [Bacteroidales bacterium]|nr:LamG-like jellyroll fold domain-containing protein [Bacteroidales bacterium]
DGFDVNYDSFDHLALQYKESSKSDDEWVTLMSYYNDSLLYLDAIDNGIPAKMVDPGDAGTIRYALKMDDMPDQRYDLRGVTYCLINNELFENYSDTRHGIKDMYNPRLFGSAQPANGILTIEDNIRLNFNEQIADGYLTKNNFRVTGIRNGATTSHSVSVSLDGENDYMATEFDRNYAGKDITVEMWINTDTPQDATLFSHGTINESLELSLTADNHLSVTVGETTVSSRDQVPFEAGSWAHVALVYTKKGQVSAYYNFNEMISRAPVDPYTGTGNIEIGRSISSDGNSFKGRMHNVRVWNGALSSGSLQINSLAKLSGNEQGLIAYYPMTEGKGSMISDKALGAHLIMNGCAWSLPEGRAVSFNGSDNYLKISTGSSAVIDSTMDYTLEFWFKGEPGQANATLLSGGRGDGTDLGGSKDLVCIGFDSNGELSFLNNGFITGVSGTYLDNNWHHFALSVNRTIGRGQIYVDGILKNYFDAGELGGVASSFMYLGTRAYYNEGDAMTLHTDQFFHGSIDELRIWNLYKNESLVQESNNVKLNGNEMGLLAYYPFEYYKEFMGLKELDFTLADMKVQHFAENKVPDAVAHGSSQTSDIAPVKDRGPVADLGFDFVVNNDALIINLKEPWERIEKTIVTFTVNGVRDMNGNENISPLSWSAYIDRNQLKWDENELNLEKPVYQPTEFTVKAVNKGGSPQHFRISNLPDWMDVDPSSGTLDPNSSADITFTIDEGLNVGTYNEVVYLTNDENVSEALEINLQVKGEKPSWSVNLSDYKYNMSVYGKMRFSNIFSNDEEDILGAFENGACIGVTTSTYDKNLDMWYALLTVYANDTKPENLEFRMWDASTGKVYQAIPDRPVTYANDAIIGSPGAPVIFDGIRLIYQDITLAEGWNWISFNLYNENLTDINATLKYADWTENDVIKSVDFTDSYSAMKGRWTGSLSLNGGLNNLLMYKLRSSENQAMSISGAQVDAAVTPFTIKAGRWNFIGYLPGVNLPVWEALAGYPASDGDIIKSQDAFAMFWGNNWTGNLEYMQPNKGYMLLNTSDNDLTLYYPSATDRTKKSAIATDNTTVAEMNYHAYPSNLNIVATAGIISPDDKIYASVNGELRGVSVTADDLDDLRFITVAGQPGDDMIEFTLHKSDNTTLHSVTSVPFMDNNVYGSVGKPLVLKFDENKDDIKVYPSPFRDHLNISFTPITSGKVLISIIDITGKQIYYSASPSSTEARFEKMIDTSTLEPGMYFVHILENETLTIKKVVK